MINIVIAILAALAVSDAPSGIIQEGRLVSFVNESPLDWKKISYKKATQQSRWKDFSASNTSGIIESGATYNLEIPGFDCLYRFRITAETPPGVPLLQMEILKDICIDSEARIK